MGSQIAFEHALAGHRVIALARSPDATRARLADVAEVARDVRLHSAEVSRAAVERIRIETDATVVRSPVALIQESIVEDFRAKATVIAPLARRFPDAVIATNTSSLSISALGEAIDAATRVIGMHYWNPPLLMPLVEVVAGRDTSRATVAFACELVRTLGKRPIMVSREVPGFVWNRLQFALLREALWLVEEGVATAEAIDEVVRDGLARRLRYTGPFQTVSLGGIETFRQIADALFPVLSSLQEASGLSRHVPLEQSELIELRRRRDAGLARDLRDDRSRASEDAVTPGDTLF